MTTRGETWEHDAHLYFRRADAGLFLNDATLHKQRLGIRIGL
jgi:hypothetical protein